MLDYEAANEVPDVSPSREGESQFDKLKTWSPAKLQVLMVFGKLIWA